MKPAFIFVFAAIALMCVTSISHGQSLLGNNLFLYSVSPHTDFPDLYFINDGHETRFTQFNGSLNYYTDNGNRTLYVSPGAAADALALAPNGVSIGGYSTGDGLTVYSGDFSDIQRASIAIFDQRTPTELRTMLKLINNGPARFEFENFVTRQTWAFQTNNADGFLINRLGSGGNEFSIRKSGMVTMGPGGKKNFVLDPAGNLQIDGTLTQLSDRDKKEAFEEIDGDDLLDKIGRMPIQSWRYKDDPKGVRHIGPVAQDFYQEFGVGKDDKTISTVDADGVALASIQALKQQLDDQEQRNRELESRVAELESIMSELVNR